MSGLVFLNNHVNLSRFNFLASNVLKIYPCQNELFASDNGSSGFDRYLNSGANLLKLIEVVWLYLALFNPY